MVIMIPANLSMVIYFISQTTSTISLYVSWPQDLIMAFFFLFGFSNKKGVQPWAPACTDNKKKGPKRKFED